MKQFPSAIVEVTRGVSKRQSVESKHLVDIVIADADGAMVRTYGNPERLIFPRSAIKSLQALQLIETGAADQFKLDDKYLALACSSHNGEAMHVEGSTEIISRAGLEPICLECGAQMPARSRDRNELAKAGLSPTALHNNCSGKHAGFLALAAHMGVDPKGYIKFEHEVQQMIAGTLEEVTGAKHSEDNYGIDGCSIPTYKIPLEKLALAYAKFGVGRDAGNKRAKAMIRLRDACMAHPQMVAGEKRFDTNFMEAFKGRVFTKTGAEGVFIACVPELGLGIALKCLDGTTRAAETACAATIESLLELSQEEAKAMKRFTNPILKNWNGIEVGQLRMAADSFV